jgi:outer membrane protein assembly factor BamA
MIYLLFLNTKLALKIQNKIKAVPLIFIFSFIISSLFYTKATARTAYEPEDSTNISVVIIRNISIQGNKKTKDIIILREMSFKPGDTLKLSDIEKAILLSRNRIFNTGLFVTVDLIIEGDAAEKNLLIKVKERFYTYPVPIVALADRNFNEWWQQRGHDIRRINYGLFFVQKNVRGRNETFRTMGQLGFTKKIDIGYYIPYLTKKQKLGLNVLVSYSTNRQVAFETKDHKLHYVELENDKVLRKLFASSATFTYRGKFYQTQYFTGSFFYNDITDSIARLNPRYFLEGRTTQRYFSLKYSFVHDFRDISYYPLKGSYFRIDAEKLGLGIFKDINQINFRLEYNRYLRLSNKFYLAGGIKQKISFPYNQPYYNFKSQGYGSDYISGYELYVIDGQHFSLAKVNLKYQLFSKKIKLEDMPVNQFETIPFALYLRAYSDAGYVRDNSFNPLNTRLANKFLLGGGIALDLVTYYDLVFRLEYSVNRLQQQGVYLHMKAPI